MWGITSNLASGLNKTMVFYNLLSVPPDFHPGRRTEEEVGILTIMIGPQTWRPTFSRCWLVKTLVHLCPQWLHLPYKCSVRGISGSCSRFLFWAWTEFVFSRTSCHREEVELVAGQLLFSRETSNIPLCQHACDKARWANFLLFCIRGNGLC